MTYNALIREAAQDMSAARYQAWQQEMVAMGFSLHPDVPSAHIDQFENRVTGKTIYIERDATGIAYICHPHLTPH